MSFVSPEMINKNRKVVHHFADCHTDISGDTSTYHGQPERSDVRPDEDRKSPPTVLGAVGIPHNSAEQTIGASRASTTSTWLP
jgi:hypothetical protein